MARGGYSFEAFDREWETGNAGSIAWSNGRVDWDVVNWEDLDPSQYVEVVAGLAFHAMQNNGATQDASGTNDVIQIDYSLI